MISLPKATAFITSVASVVGTIHHPERFARPRFDSRRPQREGSPEAIMRNGAERSLGGIIEKPARILLVDGTHTLQDSHLLLLRSIPAIVQTLTSCADMYLHKEHGYSLVILALHSESRETTEAAHFVRHRWSSARILLLKGESAMIDDWLYDERIEPQSQPATVQESAARLMTKTAY
jgi:hypothetical protein